MDSHGSSNMIGPLSFPEDGCHESSSKQEDANGQVTCLLCTMTFELPGHRSHLLKHVQHEHNLLIADVNLICDLKRYVAYWKERFIQKPLTDFCTLVKPTEENACQYYVLSDVLLEDKTLREDLQRRRLASILNSQQREREDSTFSRGCLFCREHFEGNRSALFNHMAFDHHFHIGHPNNIVLATEFLDILEDKLNNLKCLYCDKTFKDRNILKEHMRKKMHKRLNPRNPIYDRFYIINYLELGKNWEAVQSESDGEEDEKTRYKQDAGKDFDNWEEWEEDCGGGAGAVCLFCSTSAADIQRLEAHMLAVHTFDLHKSMQGLNFYLRVKLINFIRRCVHQRTCMICRMSFTKRDQLMDHMISTGHMTQLPGQQEWDQPQYFFPTYENDSLLCELEDDLCDETERPDRTRIIAEDSPVPSNSILTDRNVLEELRES